LKEDKEYVGEPHKLMGESKAPERFGSHLAMVTSRLDFEATSYELVADILTESLPRGKDVYFRDKLGVVSNTFLGKRECSDWVPWKVVPLCL
jgi:hypothetical protein